MLDLQDRMGQAPRRRRLEPRDRGTHLAEPAAARRGSARVPRRVQAETVTVVVDASFPNRIDEASAPRSRRRSTGEVISPPAGVIGRGDAFLLQIAERADAVVLSNDSFQEFHGQYGWLFDQGRSWVASRCRTSDGCSWSARPVRGPLSRRSVSDAKKAAKKAAPAAGRRRRPPTKAAKARRHRAKARAAGAARRGRRGAQPTTGQRRRRWPPASPTTAAARRRRRRRSAGAAASQPVQRGARRSSSSSPRTRSAPRSTGEVERFASHGAYVMATARGATCR